MLDHNWLLLVALFLGIAVMAATGVALLAVAVYGFYRWIEINRRWKRRNKRRKSHLHYRDML